MRKIGFSLSDSYALPTPDVVRLLRDIGFDAVSPLWQRDGCLDETVRAARDCGLILQSLHGPLRGLPGMWSREEDCFRSIVGDLLASADACAAYGIPILVVHSWGGIPYTFRKEALYFDHFDRLVEHAHSLGIRISFENLEGPEFLDALMARYQDSETVGFCWDCGHELCYTPSRDFLRCYGDRLLMTHLNDNYGVTRPDGQLLGTDDLHLLPGDGIADWTAITNRLKLANPQEILNFELKIRPKGDRCTTDLYSKIPLEQFLVTAYKRACRVSDSYFV